MSSFKDKFRAAAFKSGSRVVQFEVDINGEKMQVPILRPTVAFRDDLLKIQKRNPTQSEIIEFILKRCVVDPDTHEPVFESTDRESIKELPANGWAEEVIKKVFELIIGQHAASCECGAQLAPPFKHCPACGKEQPAPQEVAEKN